MNGGPPDRLDQEATITAAPLDEDAAVNLARSLLSEGHPVEEVVARTGLTQNHVEMLASSSVKADVARLAQFVNDRLRELGMSQLEASKLGLVSRSTLNLLGKPKGDGKELRVPGRTVLSKLDELCSWEAGSAHAIMFGSMPTPRETQVGKRPRPVINPDAEDDFDNLAMWIEKRLLELQMTKSRLAAVGGPGRTTLATLGKRGYQTSPETLERLDTHLMWEPGSALATLKGGIPVNRRIEIKPHPALVPVTSVIDKLKVLKTRAERQQLTLDQQIKDIDQALTQAYLVVEDLGSPRPIPASTPTTPSQSSS
ncbi:hypothetical protein [Mycobacteroides abscessus]|uniref:hypothetical protein n=1 Tax=Mycobacteroides abscessus TaxID=36809 RepID=UPI0009A62A13|nr:hypothetical protein [Mycobacteroides abscessus]SLJ75951.1 Uncharacterised protein [Mycobacteroides abscessus subsp. abscessus]SLJ77707.1 Uncharacterised protein [Mycobacteroides abscessus subsp. abscessus]